MRWSDGGEEDRIFEEVVGKEDSKEGSAQEARQEETVTDPVRRRRVSIPVPAESIPGRAWWHRPLWVAIAVSLLSAATLTWQQRSQRALVWEQKADSVLTAFSLMAGTSISYYDQLTQAHEQSFPSADYERVLLEADRQEATWLSEQGNLESQVARYFPGSDVDSAWSELTTALELADSTIDDLDGFKPRSRHPDYSRARESARTAHALAHAEYVGFQALLRRYIGDVMAGRRRAPFSY